jgi:hypothetical protein
MDQLMRTAIATIFAVSASLALSSCSDPDFADMCATAAGKKIPKGAEISVTKKTITKQGLSATVTLDLTAVTKKKDADDILAYYKASCIVKGDRVSKAFLRPASAG